MKKNRKLSAVAAVSAVALVFTGVGASSANAAGEKITFIQGVAGDAFYITMGCGIAEAAAKAGAVVTTQGGAKWDATVQKPVLDSVIASKPQAILIAANDKTVMQKPIESAIEAGINLAPTTNSDKPRPRFSAPNEIKTAISKAGTVILCT